MSSLTMHRGVRELYAPLDCGLHVTLKLCLTVCGLKKSYKHIYIYSYMWWFLYSKLDNIWLLLWFIFALNILWEIRPASVITKKKKKLSLTTKIYHGPNIPKQIFVVKQFEVLPNYSNKHFNWKNIFTQMFIMHLLWAVWP